MRKTASIPLRVELWNGHCIDLAPEFTVKVRVTKPAAAVYLLTPNLARLGEAFVKGHLWPRKGRCAKFSASRKR